MTLFQWPKARAIWIWRLRASYIMWGLISKLFARGFSWQPRISPAIFYVSFPLDLNNLHCTHIHNMRFASNLKIIDSIIMCWNFQIELYLCTLGLHGDWDGGWDDPSLKEFYYNHKTKKSLTKSHKKSSYVDKSFLMLKMGASLS